MFLQIKYSILSHHLANRKVQVLVSDNILQLTLNSLKASLYPIAWLQHPVRIELSASELKIIDIISLVRGFSDTT